MSINSPDLHILVSRSTEAEKATALRERLGQDGVVAASIGQKAQTERDEHRVLRTPKSLGSKVDQDGQQKQGQEQKQRKGKRDQSEVKSETTGTNGHLLDIKL